MPEFCEVALPVPVDQLFTYSIPKSLSVSLGVRVIVPFGARQLVGVVAGLTSQLPDIAAATIRPVKDVLDDQPVLFAEMLALGKWIADYYLVPIGEALASLLPPRAPVRRSSRVVLTAAGEEEVNSNPDSAHGNLLRRIARRHGIRRETLRDSWPRVKKLRRQGLVAFEHTATADHAARQTTYSGPADATERTKSPDLSQPQVDAFAAVRRQLQSGKFGVLLLHGVTGSGKTEVYLRSIELALQRNQSALMLVPEITLTPAMSAIFAGRFGDRMAVLHSGLSASERETQWRRVQAGLAPVVIGTRSAVFAPLDNLGLVIVDEEHDTSYKQDETPRYHGRDVAIVRAQQAGSTVVLGSATPILESRYNAEKGKYQLLEIDQRVMSRSMPVTEVVDMRQEFADTGKQSFLSRRLEEEIQLRLGQNEQCLILLNRRGYYAFCLCRSCGQTVQCQNCSIALTHHLKIARLMCHYCGYCRPIPRACPQCASEHIYFVGEGSERIEESLHQRFPQARIGRLDRDTARGKQQAEAILSAFHNQAFDILVGTQMIAKGHDIHRVTLVGVISADIGLARPDFRSAERTFQLLTQVSGRAGRGELPGEVIIQTYYPDHYAIRSAAAHDYESFYAQELKFRQLMHYPPFTVLASLMVRSEKEDAALLLAAKLGQHLAQAQKMGIKVLGPAPSTLYRLKNDYRFQFLIKASNRNRLRELLLSVRNFAQRDSFPATSLVMDVDPQWLG